MAADQLRRIPVPDSPCIRFVNGLGWLPPFGVRAGPYLLGVRANDEAARAVLHDVLGDRVVTGPDEGLPHNVTVHLEAPSDREVGRAVLNRCYLGHEPMVRSLDPARAVATMLDVLDAHARAFDPEPIQLCAAVLVDGEGTAVVAPNAERRRSVSHSRLVGRRGLRLVDRPWSRIDLDDGTVVVPETEAVELPPRYRAPDDDHDPPVAAGRYPIGTWTSYGEDSPGADLAAVARTVVNLAQLEDPGGALARLRGLRATIPRGPLGVSE